MAVGLMAAMAASFRSITLNLINSCTLSECPRVATLWSLRVWAVKGSLNQRTLMGRRSPRLAQAAQFTIDNGWKSVQLRKRWTVLEEFVPRVVT